MDQTERGPISDHAEAPGDTTLQGPVLVHMIDLDHNQDYLEEENHHHMMDSFLVQCLLDHIQGREGDSLADKDYQHQEGG